MLDSLPDAASLADEASGLRPTHDDVPWLDEAHRMMAAGPAELRGRRELLHRLGRLNQRTPWTVPWCGLFVAHCLRVALPRIAIPVLPMRARPWRHWGAETRPQVGALMLFWHYDERMPFGHVAFYWAEDRDAYHVLGGNQGHRVCVQRYPKERFVTARWPEGVAQPGRTRRGSPDACAPARVGLRTRGGPPPPRDSLRGSRARS